MCRSRKYPYSPHRGFFLVWMPQPPGYSSLGWYFPLKILAFETPPPPPQIFPWPSVVGVWIFSGTTQLNHNGLFDYRTPVCSFVFIPCYKGWLRLFPPITLCFRHLEIHSEQNQTGLGSIAFALVQLAWLVPQSNSHKMKCSIMFDFVWLDTTGKRRYKLLFLVPPTCSPCSGLYLGVRTCETHGRNKTCLTKAYSKTITNKQRKYCQVITPK